ncbi:MAG: GNAT family N-acetyltransferase [Alphaproteobacteria bacterium]|nr:GNAT family N-acetyltransferase [Alphaproteobacteria bacterium]
MSIRVREVESAADRERFLELPRRLHADDPAWVGPPVAWLRRRLAPSNPFFDDAELKLFLAERGGEVVGTISVLRDRRHEEHRGEAVAFFGFFECVDDPAVAEALFDRARAVARGWGASVLRGPRDLSRVEHVGLTIEGHDVPPPMLAGHHPAWYRPLVEGQGFQKHHDHLAYETPVIGPDGERRELPRMLARQARMCRLPGLEIQRARWRRLGRDLSAAHEVFVEAFRDVPENTPMPKAQFLALGRAFLLVSDTRMMQLATVDGRVAGFALCFPELNEALAAGRGRRGLLGAARAVLGLRRVRTASFKLLGVLPEHRRSGLYARLVAEAIEGVRQAGYERLEASLIDERNRPMRHIVEAAGMTVYKRYRVYEQPLA